MAKPRRSTEEEIYDIFASWNLDDQVVALRVMQQIHRMKKGGKIEISAVPLAAEPKGQANSANANGAVQVEFQE